MTPNQSMHPIDLLQLSTELPVEQIVLLGFDPNDCTPENLARVRGLLGARKQRAGGPTRFVQPEARQQLKRKFASREGIRAPAIRRSTATGGLSAAAFEEPVPDSASPQLPFQNDVDMDTPATTAVDASVGSDEFASDSDTNTNSDLGSIKPVSDNDADSVTSSVVLLASRATANVTTTKARKARPGHGLSNAEATRLTNGMPDKGKSICPLCPGSYSRKHIVKRHLMDFKHECSRCGLVLTTKRSYERHRALDNCVRAVQDDVPEPSRKRVRLT
ncbi:hypothetical protein EXIGLDRAFT_759332 [Exidia glandulosa HHB12029]|uniref:Uncharacterized protein n=1 Tax=Exidia glandulosa HHB12029 TaxID=1314781 RepID=A0A165Q366_EXIGL|nr:hypothetical protein EXIGLDRAFT_759332 [Exidia glandulosa HHB12029]